MRISYNAPAMVAVNSLNRNDEALSNSTGKLSSGFKINRPKDNPTGYALSRRMKAQLAGLNQAKNNENDGISIIKTADGTLGEVHDMLQRLNELCIKSANGTMSDGDREQVEKEVSELKNEIQRIADSTEFNGQKLLNGTFDLRGYSNEISVKVLTYENGMTAGKYSINFEKEIPFLDGVLETYLGAEQEELENLRTHDATEEDIRYTVSERLQEFLASKVNVTFEDGSAVTGVKVDSMVDNTMVLKGDKGFSLTITIDKAFAAVSQYETQPVMIDDPEDTAVPPRQIPKTDPYSGAVITEVVEVRPGTLATAPASDVTVELTNLGTMTLQVGGNEGQTLDVQIPSVSLKGLGLENLTAKTKDGALEGIDRVTAAINKVSDIRSRLGAYQNRLESTVTMTDNLNENMTAALSTVTDTDMAEEYSNYSTYQILTQATTSVLAQANKRPSDVLQLLQ
ncbi:MAG: flagellin [Lachnospiraceae bacterium]|nr:flagellin [Lachnospiraceae bacterium]